MNAASGGGDGPFLSRAAPHLVGDVELATGIYFRAHMQPVGMKARRVQPVETDHIVCAIIGQSGQIVDQFDIQRPAGIERKRRPRRLAILSRPAVHFCDRKRRGAGLRARLSASKRRCNRHPNPIGDGQFDRIPACHGFRLSPAPTDDVLC